MKNTVSEKIASSIAFPNPPEIARQNIEKNHTWVARVYGSKFKRLTAEKGIGRFLLYIRKYPGCTKNELFEKIFKGGPTGGEHITDFTSMTNGKLIENHRPGYFITDLGIAMINYFNLK